MTLEKKRERQREYARKRRLDNPEAIRASQKKYGEKNFDLRKNIMLKLRFNITIDEYKLMLENQNGVCKICNMSETARKNNSNEVRMLCVDHDHKTGKVRGLLCNNCNRALGHYEASKPRAQEFEKYLEESVEI